MDIFLEEMPIKDFKKNLYNQYKKIFTAIERKPLFIIKRNIKKGTMKILAIKENKETTVGFMIVTVRDIKKVVYLEYFAILPQYQSKGYGSKSLNLLKEYFNNFIGIALEIEKVGYGINEEDNLIRSRRQKFYERNGLRKLHIPIKLFGKDYEVYFFDIKENEYTDRDILMILREVYVQSLGERRTKKYFRF